MRRLLLALALAGAASLLAVASASANIYTTTGPFAATGDSPFVPGCGGPGEGFHTPSEVPGVNFLNTEVEPWFEVNPTDPLNVVGFIQQDRWSDGGAHGLVAAVSHDGAMSWSESWPAFSNCAGGTPANGGGYERSSDPWISFAPNGRLHAISISFDRSTAHNAVLTSYSDNGGDTWSAPTTLREDNSNSGPLANLFNDKESITADPVTAGNVYAVWDRIESPNNNPLTPPQAYAQALAFRGPTWFARSTNNGASWDTAREIFAPQASRTQTIANQIVVLPDGTLVDGFTYIKGSNGHQVSRGDSAAVIFSTDQGETWSSDATIIANQGDTGNRDPEPVNCPGDNTPSTPCLLVRTGNGIPDFAADYTPGPTRGYLYAVWQTHQSFTVDGIPVDDAIMLSRSIDGGHTWSTPVKVNQTPATAYNPQAFTPSVHVSTNGDVAVTYYDFRNDVQGDPALSTDYWIVHCHAAMTDCSKAAGWPAGQENRLTPPPGVSFDMRSAPYAIGYFVGDYEGLDNASSIFAPFFVQANGTHATPLTNAFFSTAGP